MKTEFPMPIKSKEYNALIERIAEGGMFSVPNPNQATGFRVGHIGVVNPKPDHPREEDSFFPIGYAGYNVLRLLNTNKPELKEYHSRLKTILTSR